LVSVSLVVIHDEVAGVYSVATLPDARRQGLGACITALPLHQLAGQGVERAVLHASSMGYPVYQKLGFVDDGEVAFWNRTPGAE
jgi:predicted GNAT family acetyltransferase